MSFNDLGEISFREILLGNSRFLNVPRLEELNRPIDFLKRKLIKVLGLWLKQETARRSIDEIIFGNCGNNVVFVSYTQLRLIYGMHCPQMNIVEVARDFDDETVDEALMNAKRIPPSDLSAGMTVFFNSTQENLLRAYRLQHPSKTIVVRFHDWIGGALNQHAPGRDKHVAVMNKLRQEKVVDYVESYCQHDALALNAIYRPNGVHLQAVREFDSQYRSGLYRFKGGTNPVEAKSDRLRPLLVIRDKLLSIYPKIGSWIEARRVESTSKEAVPYPEYLRQAACNEVCIDLYRVHPEEGFSFRIPEALALNRKIITNRACIKNEPFYSPERVFVIGVDDLDRLQKFLEAELEPLPKEILKFYDASLWWTAVDPLKGR